MFFYEGNSTNPVCVQRINELYESYYIDSSFYNDLGQLVRKNCYESSNGYSYDLYAFAEYTYNDKGQKTKCEVYTNQYFIHHESTIHYHYDGNDRLSYMEVDYMEDDWGEKISFVYNGDNLVVEETYSSDYGNGYIVEEMTKYTYDKRLLVKKEYFYVYEDEYLDEGYFIYEYEYDNIVDIIETQVLASNIYPNPVKDILNVEAENIDFVELYDIYGRKLYSEVTSGNAEIDMNNFANGIYFIKIYYRGNSSVKKIVKE